MPGKGVPYVLKCRRYSPSQSIQRGCCIVYVGVLTHWVTVFSVCELCPVVHSFPVMQKRGATKRCQCYHLEFHSRGPHLFRGHCCSLGPFPFAPKPQATILDIPVDAFVDY